MYSQYLNQADSKLGIQSSENWLKKGAVDASAANALNSARNRARELGMAADQNQTYKNGAESTQQNRTEAVEKFNRVFKNWQESIDHWKKMNAQWIQAGSNWEKRKANCPNIFR